MTEVVASSASSQTDAPTYGALRKYTLLMVFCLSNFLDVFNVSSLFSAIPTMTTELGLTGGEAVWLVSAYQLAFAALFLSSGRISDLYNPKYVFAGGAGVLGVLSLVTSFLRNKIAILVVRAITGTAAAMTIPSSLALLVRLFTERQEQARAISVFAVSAALGNVLGLIIGAVLIEYASWPWVFRLGAFIAIPVAIVAVTLVPVQPKVVKDDSKLKYIDLPGISILAAGLVLLIFAFTSTGTESWGSAMVLAPLIISIFILAAFFFWEARIPADKAAFPPRIWWYPNFGILFGVALSVFLWFSSVFYLIITYWQDLLHWSAINAAVHFLPLGVVAGPMMLFSGRWTERYEKKYVLLSAQVLLIISTCMLPFADTARNYWRIAFPAFVIGTTGGSLLFVNANVAIFQNTPPEIAGTVGAIFNSALQLGSAVGVAIITSIQLSIDKKNQGKENADIYAGRAAGFWFLLGLIVVETAAVLVFYRTTQQLKKPTDEEKAVDEERTVSEEVDNVTLSDEPVAKQIKAALSGESTVAATPALSRQDTKVEGTPVPPSASDSEKVATPEGEHVHLSA